MDFALQGAYMTDSSSTDTRSETNRRRGLGDLSLRARLMMAFLFLSLLVCSAGGSGLYFIGLISREMKNVIEVGTPMIETVHNLSMNMKEARLLCFDILELQDAARIEQKAGRFDALAAGFTESLSKLRALARESHVDFMIETSDSRPSTEDMNNTGGTERDSKGSSQFAPEVVHATHEQFSKQARKMIRARLRRLQHEAAARKLTAEKVEEFRTEVDQVDDKLTGVSQIIESRLASREEAARTSLVAGEASPEDLTRIIENFYDTAFPLAQGTSKIRHYIGQMREIAYAYLAEKNQDRLEELRKRFDTQLRAAESLTNRVKRRVKEDDILKGFTAVQEDLPKLKEALFRKGGIFSLHKELREARETVDRLQKSVSSSAGLCEDAINEIAEKANEIRQDAKAASQGVVDSARGWEFVIIGIGLVVSLGFGFMFARAISGPIEYLSEKATLISEGDLRIEVQAVDRRDEIGSLTEAFRGMLVRLREQTRQTMEGVNVLSTSAAEISSAAAQLATSSSKTSEMVSDSSTTAEELRHAAQVASEKAKGVAASSQEAVKISNSGSRATQDTIDRMNLIKQQMQSIGETVVKLSEQSQAIENIVGSVQDLADQSNLLAVNASIEAARAGDRGKGFAVVAHEIKSLADQSKEATEQVRTILDETRRWVSAVVMATEEGSKAVDAGLRQSLLAGEAIRTVNETVMASSQAASVIGASTDEQFTGVEQVVAAMANIDQSAQQALAASNQLHSESTRVADLSETLKQLVAQYKT